MGPHHSRATRHRAGYIIWMVGVFVFATILQRSSIYGSSTISCPPQASFEQTTNVLTNCLSTSASDQEVADLLQTWGRIQPNWGGVSQAHILPGEGQQLVIRYYPDAPAYWKPQGKLIVLQREAQHWRAVAVPIEITLGSGEIWDDWEYHILATGDITGDGLDDLLVATDWSNGTHAFLTYTMLLTAHPKRSALQTVFLEDASLKLLAYSFVEFGDHKALRSVVQIEQQSAITNTLSFNGDTLMLVKTSIDPKLCTTRATTPDGSLWCGFDQFDDVRRAQLGLYRVKDGLVSHFDIPSYVRVLKVAPDGSLYVGASPGVLRYRNDQWETLLALDGSDSRVNLAPEDIAFTTNGDVWVGGRFGLARFDGKTWTQYDISARRLLIVPDGSLWAEGSDGSGDCCFVHITGNTWVLYNYSAALPASEDLLKKVHALLDS